MAGMEPVCTTCCHGGGSGNSVDDSNTIGEGRSIAFPTPALTVEIGDRPITGHLEETSNCAVFGRRLLHGTSPSRPAYRSCVVTINQPFHQQIPLTYTRSAYFYSCITMLRAVFLKYLPWTGVP